MPYPSYCTQIDSTGNGHYRCGGACLASVLLDDGWQSDPWGLTVQVSDEEGWTDVGCTSDQMIDAAQRRGLNGRKFTYWEELEDALLAGEAPLLLLNNVFLVPRSYPPGHGWESLHWVRCAAFSNRDDMLYLYDPLTWIQQLDGSVYQGPVASTQEGCTQAIATTSWPEAGVILTSTTGRNLNFSPVD